jgi:creatinine amidohydrolase
MQKPKMLATDNAEQFFEDNRIGRLKKEIWDADEARIDKWLKDDFELPSPSELGKANCYIQTTPRHRLAERRRKNDLVFVPIGSSECHGDALATGHDIFQVTQVLEGIRRYTAQKGYEVNLAYPISYGGHPYHHLGMPGTIVMPQDILAEQLIAIMLGLWNDGFRKIILVSNHGHAWTIVTAVQEFCKRYQLPGIFQTFDVLMTCREFFRPYSGHKNEFKEPFAHAGEAETAWGQLLFPEMVDNEYISDASGKKLMKDGWFDNSVTDYCRPHQWFEGEGHAAIEMHGTPEGVCGQATLADPCKAKRPIAAMAKILTLLVEDILESFPAGTVPPVELTTLRTEAEMAPFLKEPLSDGWKSVYAIPRIGAFEK